MQKGRPKEFRASLNRLRRRNEVVAHFYGEGYGRQSAQKSKQPSPSLLTLLL